MALLASSQLSSTTHPAHAFAHLHRRGFDMNRRAGIFVLIASALASCAVLLITVLYRHGGRAKNAPIVNGSEARPLKANDGAIQWPSGPQSEAGLIRFEDNNIEVGSIEVDGN